jgi:predicted ABC-type ATPase
MIDWTWLDLRPCLIAIAGPNGAGKTTFYEAHVAPAGLPFVNADRLANQLSIDAYEAAELASAIRSELMQRKESFVFETVFSDPVGEKVTFLKTAAKNGFYVTLCFVGLESALLSEERVAMRVTQGGHDVPSGKLKARFPRTLANLKSAIVQLPHVLVFDNSDLSHSFSLIAIFKDGKST